jgi:Fatty acid desaturase
MSDTAGGLHRDLHSSLEPHLESLLTRHKDAAAKVDWSCHEFLPLEAFRADPRRHRPLSRPAYTAVEMALLTEVNLPWYTAGLYHGLRGCPAPIQEFVRVWTSEEDQHSTLLETYLLLSGNGSRRARPRAQGRHCGRLEPPAGRSIRRDGLHRHPGSGDTHLLPLHRACVRPGRPGARRSAAPAVDPRRHRSVRQDWAGRCPNAAEP